MKGAPRLRAARHPFTKAPLRHARRSPPARCDLIHRCASIPYLLLFLLLLLFLFPFFSSVGLQRAKRSPNFFFSFLGPKRCCLVPVILKEQGLKRRCFGTFYFKKEQAKTTPVLTLISFPAPFSSCFQPDNSSKFCPSLNHVVEKWRRRRRGGKIGKKIEKK